MHQKLSDEISILRKTMFLGCFGVTLVVPEKVTLGVEKLYEVCNELTPDTLLGLCCIGL